MSIARYYCGLQPDKRYGVMQASGKKEQMRSDLAFFATQPEFLGENPRLAAHIKRETLIPIYNALQKTAEKIADQFSSHHQTPTSEAEKRIIYDNINDGTDYQLALHLTPTLASFLTPLYTDEVFALLVDMGESSRKPANETGRKMTQKEVYAYDIEQKKRKAEKGRSTLSTSVRAKAIDLIYEDDQPDGGKDHDPYDDEVYVEEEMYDDTGCEYDYSRDGLPCNDEYDEADAYDTSRHHDNRDEDRVLVVPSRKKAKTVRHGTNDYAPRPSAVNPQTGTSRSKARLSSSSSSSSSSASSSSSYSTGLTERRQNDQLLGLFDALGRVGGGGVTSGGGLGRENGSHESMGVEKKKHFAQLLVQENTKLRLDGCLDFLEDFGITKHMPEALVLTLLESLEKAQFHELTQLLSDNFK